MMNDQDFVILSFKEIRKGARRAWSSAADDILRETPTWPRRRSPLWLIT